MGVIEQFETIRKIPGWAPPFVETHIWFYELQIASLYIDSKGEWEVGTQGLRFAVWSLAYFLWHASFKRFGEGSHTYIMYKCWMHREKYWNAQVKKKSISFHLSAILGDRFRIYHWFCLSFILSASLLKGTHWIPPVGKILSYVLCIILVLTKLHCKYRCKCTQMPIFIWSVNFSCVYSSDKTGLESSRNALWKKMKPEVCWSGEY